MTVPMDQWTTAGLWLAVIASGLYHGINPGMGWPLAVSAGLMGRSRRDLIASLWPIGAGHFLAMIVILLPFSVLAVLVTWQQEIRIGAAILVIVFGIYLLINRRHPRFLARISPRRLAFWSFWVAIAHGASLMLVPIYLGLCRGGDVDAGHGAAQVLMSADVMMALAVSVAHTIAMVLAGALMAFVTYEWVGLGLIARSWFNLDVVWAASLILIGCISLLAVVVAS